MHLICLVVMLFLSGCAFIGDECGPDAGGVHGETLCSEGTCVHDPRVLKSICLEDNLPRGAECVSHSQCGNEQQELYCQHASDNAQTGQCAPALDENEPCNLSTHCNEGLFCLEGLCRPPQPIGGPCWISPTIQHCQDGLICGLPDGLTLPLDEDELERYDPSDGRCRVGGKEGEACNDYSGIGCAPGFYCKDNNTICVKSKS